MESNLLPFPVYFKLKNKHSRYLFFDAFVRDNELILIGSYYPDIRFDFKKIRVEINNFILVNFEDIGYPGPEQVRVIIYQLNEKAIRSIEEGVIDTAFLKIVFKNKEYNFSVNIINKNKFPGPGSKPLTIATLFADNDFNNIDSFLSYYYCQGVDCFYLYFNGEINRLQSARPDIFGKPGVFIGEWKYPYFLEVSRLTKFTWRVVNRIKPLKRVFNYFNILHFTFNHAQMAFLTMARYRFLPDCSHIIFIDIDERLFYPDGTLKEYLNKYNPETEIVKCYWAEETGSSWINFVKQHPYQSTKLLTNTYHNGSNGVKTIYRGDYKGLLRIHFPAIETLKTHNWSSSLKLFHLANLRNRKDLVKGEVEEIII